MAPGAAHRRAGSGEATHQATKPAASSAPPRPRSPRPGRRGAAGSAEPRRRRRAGVPRARARAPQPRPRRGSLRPGTGLSGRRHGASPPPSVTDADTRSGLLPALAEPRAGRDSSSGRRPRHLQARGSVPRHLGSGTRGRGRSVLRAALGAPGSIPRRQLWCCRDAEAGPSPPPAPPAPAPEPRPGRAGFLRSPGGGARVSGTESQPSLRCRESGA